MQKAAIRNELIFACCIALLISLFFSRVFTSISIIALAGASFFHKDFWQQLKDFFSNRFLVGISLLFIMPLLSGLWSSNTQAWLDVLRVKLPLLVMPLVFAGAWQLKEVRWQQLASVFLLLLLASTLWTMIAYLQNSEAIHKAYLKAQVLVTPFDNDHIRYSWLISAGILLCLFLGERKDKKTKWVIFLLAGWFAVYLHILAARTGLLCFYVILLGYVVWLLLKSKQKKIAVFGFLILVGLPIIAWKLFPTFQNRVSYFLYDFSFAQKGSYLQGSNDGSRMMSLKAGWQIVKDNPFGVGAGDVFDASTGWYRQHVPSMVVNDKLFPSSEWLIYGCIAGWIGMIVFTIIMLLPLFIQMKHRFYWIVLNLIAALSFVFDIGLESQYGVIIYVFMILWWWKWWNTDLHQRAINR